MARILLIRLCVSCFPVDICRSRFRFGLSSCHSRGYLRYVHLVLQLLKDRLPPGPSRLNDRLFKCQNTEDCNLIGLRPAMAGVALSRPLPTHSRHTHRSFRGPFFNSFLSQPPSYSLSFVKISLSKQQEIRGQSIFRNSDCNMELKR